MRIRSLRTLWTRWRDQRCDRAVDAAWTAQVAEQEATRREILDALDADAERRRLGGPR
jgi:hypothetical protein